VLGAFPPRLDDETAAHRGRVVQISDPTLIDRIGPPDGLEDVLQHTVLASYSKLDGYENILQRLAQIGAKFEMASGK
jgi:hypothetical protein